MLIDLTGLELQMTGDTEWHKYCSQITSYLKLNICCHWQVCQEFYSQYHDAFCFKVAGNTEHNESLSRWTMHSLEDI